MAVLAGTQVRFRAVGYKMHYPEGAALANWNMHTREDEVSTAETPKDSWVHSAIIQEQQMDTSDGCSEITA